MLIRILHSLCKATRLTSHSCIQRTSSNLSVEMDNSTGVVTVSMQKKPVNSLSLEFITELNICFERFENDKQCQGLVFTSNVPKIFCAGGDIMEMYQCKPGHVEQFIRALQDLWFRLYSSKLATVAAISGHCPAGASLLTMSCDYRIMSPNYTIGLPETKLGIVVPVWYIDIFINTVGFRECEKALQLGLMYNTDEALKTGMIDEIAPADSILSAAKKAIQRWIAIPAHARQQTKMAVRKRTIDNFMTIRENDVRDFVKFVTSDSTQKTLGMYLESKKKQ